MMLPSFLSSLFVARRTVQTTTTTGGRSVGDIVRGLTTNTSSVGSTTTNAEQQNEEDRPPSAFTKYLGKMKQTCPQAMQAYAQCVLQAQEDGDTTLYRACDQEFQVVQDCFRRVRQGAP